MGARSDPQQQWKPAATRTRHGGARRSRAAGGSSLLQPVAASGQACSTAAGGAAGEGPGAQRVMESVTTFLEQRLGLPVNRDKSQVALVKDVEFLGFQILRGKIRISNKARKRFKDQVRRFTPRNNGQSMYQIIHDLNQYLRGWVGY